MPLGRAAIQSLSPRFNLDTQAPASRLKSCAGHEPAGGQIKHRPRWGRAANSNQTRRRLGGGHPMGRLGITWRLDVKVNPAACSARSTDSRPAPGPVTSTSRIFTPCSDAFLAAASAATWAAYGVDLREPLKPSAPAEAQAMV